MAWPAILNLLLILILEKRQSSDIIGDRRYAAREDATEWELDRHGQSLFLFSASRFFVVLCDELNV